MLPLLAVQLEQLKMVAQRTSQRVGQNISLTVSLLGHMQAWRGQDGQRQVKWCAPSFGEDFGEVSDTTFPLLPTDAGVGYLNLKQPCTLPCSVSAISDQLHKAGVLRCGVGRPSSKRGSPCGSHRPSRSSCHTPSAASREGACAGQ